MGRFLKNAAAAAATVGLSLALAPAAWATNSGDGASVFKTQCSVCHSASAKAAAGVGPRLYGVVDRKAGSVPGFAYSPAMKKSGITWTPAELRLYVAHPGQVVKGNRMPYQGLHNPGQVDALVEYLETLK
jgi:cytochrome c